jgi:hypothetical protein
METSTMNPETANSVNQDTKKKPSLTRILPTERLALDRQVAAIRAYAAVFESNGGKAVTNEAAGVVAKLAPATIAMTNAFFVDVSILTRGEGGFFVAPEASAFLSAEHGLAPENAPEKLRPLFERHWSALLVVPRLRVGPLEFETVRKIIGEACSASTDHIQRVDRLLEFLLFVGLIKREGNQLKTANGKFGEPAVSPKNPDTTKDEDSHLETYSLTLDPERRRKIIIKAPPEVTEAELKRIQAWLSFQLIVTNT